MSQIHLQVVSGAPNVKFTSPNKFSFTMPQVYTSGSNDRVSLKSLRLYYSWYNLTAAKGNNSISYKWVDGSNHVVTLPDGIWSYVDFQGFLERTMRAAGQYLTNAGGEAVYFIRFESNPVFYRISLTVSPVPATLPAGWTAPAGWVAPGVDTTPQVVVPNTAMQNYLGFSQGSYPAAPQAALYQVNGNLVPQVTDISSLMLQTNLANNEYGPDSRTLATFNVEPGTAPGSLISEVPFYQDWIPVKPGARFQQIDVTLVDQNSRPVKLEDTAGFICTITVETPN